MCKTESKLYKEVKFADKYGTDVVEVSREEMEKELENYYNGIPHNHIFRKDTYAASGYYQRKCIICGNIDYV